MKRFGLMLLTLGMAVVACGESSGPSASTVPPPPATTAAPTTSAPPATTTTTTTTLPPLDPNARILEIRLEGGLVPAGIILNRMPMYTLFGDGRLIYEGPSLAIWPRPLLPAMVQVDIGAEGLASVLEDITRIGLPRMTMLHNSDASAQVMDGPNTVATYFDTAGEHIFSVYALRIADQKDPQVLLLADLVNRLDQLAAESPSPGPVVVERIQVLANSQSANVEHQDAVVAAWPLTSPPGEMTELDFAVRCAVITVGGEPGALQAFQDAHEMTFYEYEDIAYRYTVRPLLTGETGCVPLGR